MFVSLNLEFQNGGHILDLRLSKQAALITAPEIPPYLIEPTRYKSVMGFLGRMCIL